VLFLCEVINFKMYEIQWIIIAGAKMGI
jgi:hypothetical protein